MDGMAPCQGKINAVSGINPVISLSPAGMKSGAAACSITFHFPIINAPYGHPQHSFTNSRRTGRAQL